MGQLICGAIAVWGSCGVGQSRCGTVAMRGSRNEGQLQCGAVAVWGSVIVAEIHYVGVMVVTKPEFIVF